MKLLLISSFEFKVNFLKYVSNFNSNLLCVFIAVFGFAIFPFTMYSQNLAQNYGFETISSCPTGYSTVPVDELLKSAPWQRASEGTADLFNSCWTNGGNASVDIPLNFAGNQLAATGNSYSGIYVYNGNLSAYREYIQGTLSSTLVANENYFIRFKVNLSECSVRGIKDFGVSFNDVDYNAATSGILNVPYVDLGTSVIADFNG